MPQGTSSKCFNSSKTSRISLVDLAALDRNKVDDGGRQIVREGKHLKKSLSQLGYDDAMSLKLYIFFLSFFY
jgi:kinesin family protein 15